jgi:hypothetical protein
MVNYSEDDVSYDYWKYRSVGDEDFCELQCRSETKASG